jgi:hypothetical protein
LNLQNILNDKGPLADAEEKKENGEKLTKRKLTREEVQAAWNLFAESRKNQVGEYNLLQRDFELTDNTIQLLLSNPVEEPLLDGIKAELVEFLRKSLNSEISIEGILLKSSSKKIIYTNKEKFDHLAEKNPLLIELKERLGLDMDY